MKIHDVEREDFPVRGGDDVARLKELVDTGQSIRQDTFVIDRDVFLNKPLIAVDCVFESTVKGEMHDIVCEGLDNELLRSVLLGVKVKGFFKVWHLILHKD